MVAPGKYESSVVDYGTAKTKTNKDYIFMYFTVNGEKVKWTGYLTEKALERTMKALITAGCRDLGGVADGLNGNAFDLTTKVSITVEHEKAEGSDKTYAKVTWVNPLTQQQDATQIALGKSVLAQYQAAFLLTKQKMGVTDQSKTVVGF